MSKSKLIPIACVGILLVGTVGGIYLTSKGNTLFWVSFFPSLWSNILGVSIAAVLGIPIGFAANRIYASHQQIQLRKEIMHQFLTGIKNLRMEIESHSAVLQSLGQLCPIAPTSLQPLTTSTNMRAFLLRESEGKRLLADRSALELEEGLLLFNCGVYYHQIAELNQLVLACAEKIQQYEATLPLGQIPLVAGGLRPAELHGQHMNILNSTIHTKNQMAWNKNTELLREIEEVRTRLERGLNK